VIRTESIETTSTVMSLSIGREVDPFTDSELVRLTALNLEMAVRNLINAGCSPECLTLTADLVTHRLVAMPRPDGSVRVVVVNE